MSKFIPLPERLFHRVIKQTCPNELPGKQSSHDRLRHYKETHKQEPQQTLMEQKLQQAFEESK